VKENKTNRPSSVAAPVLRRRPTAEGGLRRVDATKGFEKTLAALPTAKHVLRLYVAGATDKSRQAVLRARQLCESELKGNFELEVIDVYQQPILARDGQIVATPTLVREFPKPVRRLIGNLADTSGLFVGLDLDTKGKTRL
jgi:circadian clock protein KaiB